MVEGIVFDVGKNYATVFTKSGEFIKLRKSGPINIGEIYKEKPYNRILKYYVAAAIIIFVLTGFTGYNAYAHQIVGYVDIAMGEGIRLYVDRVGKVQKINGINEKSLKNISIYEAIKKLESVGNKNNSSKINGKIDIKAVKIKKSSFDTNKIEEHAKQIFYQKDANKKATPINENQKKSNKENQNNSRNSKAFENEKSNNKSPIKKNNKNNESIRGRQKEHRIRQKGV